MKIFLIIFIGVIGLESTITALILNDKAFIFQGIAPILFIGALFILAYLALKWIHKPIKNGEA